VEVNVALMGDPTGNRATLSPVVASVRVLPALPPTASALMAMPAATRRLTSLVRELGPEIVDAREAMPTIAAGLATRGRERPVVIYRRQHETGRRRLRAASQIAARLADRTAVPTPAMRELAARADRVSPDRILVTRSGCAELRPVEVEEVTRARRDLGIAADAPVVGVVSRLRAEKGIDVLLAAIDRLRTEGVHVVIAGSGPEEQALRALAGRGRTPVHFLGHTNDVALWLNVADVIAMPSRRDAFPRTAIESMAAGRALVGSRVGGLRDAIDDGISGVLVPPEDPEALAVALDRVLNDRRAARSLGEAARLRYERNHTLDAAAASWRSCWEAALNGA
jgi:glycosyltransferase involved in cell wall biosynthesis